MNIEIKNSAVEKINLYSFQVDEGLRIEITPAESCSLFTEHLLMIDKKKVNDSLFIKQGIPLLISKESQKYLPNNLYLEFNPSLGFKLSSDEEVYQYNLSIKGFKWTSLIA